MARMLTTLFAICLPLAALAAEAGRHGPKKADAPGLPPAIQAQIEGLIRKLASDNLSERATARDELVAIGAPAIELLGIAPK